MGQEVAGAAGIGGGAGGAAGAAGGTAGAAASITPYLAAGTGAVNLAMDIAAASKEKDMMRAAERAATKARLEQQRIQGQNFFEALQVPTAAYDRATREITAQQQQATSALQEGDPRQLAGGLGRIGAVAGELEADTRDAMSKDLLELGKLQALEKGETADEMAKIQQSILKGAQGEAAARQVAYDQAQGRIGDTGLGLLQSGLDMIPSFGEKEEIPVPAILTENKPDLSGVKVPGSNPDFITQLLSLFGGQYKK